MQQGKQLVTEVHLSLGLKSLRDVRRDQYDYKDRDGC